MNCLLFSHAGIYTSVAHMRNTRKPDVSLQWCFNTSSAVQLFVFYQIFWSSIDNGIRC